MNDDRAKKSREERAARDRGHGHARDDDRAAAGEDVDADLPVDVGPAAESAPAAGDSTDFRDRWLRAEAELQNYRRRAQRDAEESRRNAEDRMLREVIEVVDDLDRAIGAAPEDARDDAWLAGVQLVAGKMRELLARWGVTPIEALGRPFDPHEHEALLEVDAPEGRAPGDVVTVVRTGYRRGDRVLRPARVAVARARVETR